MDGMSREEFERMKNNALENARRTHKSSLPFPDFVSIPKESDAKPEPLPPILPHENSVPPKSGARGQLPSLFRYLNLPEMMKNGDSLLLLGLILLLSNESADETLILALAYILL